MYSGATDLIGYANNVTLEGRKGGGSCMYRFVGHLVIENQMEPAGMCVKDLLAASWRPARYYISLSKSIYRISAELLHIAHESNEIESCAHLSSYRSYCTYEEEEGEGDCFFCLSIYVTNI